MAQQLSPQARKKLEYYENIGISEIPKSGPEPHSADVPQPSSAPSQDASLADVEVELGECTRCPLHETRNNIVFGVGNPNADLLFIGEAPGADEDAQGEPFVGRAGKLLTKIIEAMGLTRNDVFICNILKCRPPGNRAPKPDEAATCTPFLLKQIAAVDPKIIVCLGASAAKYILQNEKLKITKERGIVRDWNGYQLMPTYHPAFLLRNPNMKRPVWEDMQKVLGLLGLPVPEQKT